ncbi:F-box domain containing protein [Parasponia andersonii]|uniref:F-box domain containing protein n=1 Tax=Parasponia andersonii TaxID=3476 RepID=A0A2P5DAG9_PARAD|nr:F-box domain containing protein [Parasponia andersonii]
MAQNRLKTTSETPLAVDRISKLPDSVIQHILSFLPTVDVVRTSLLSNFWRRMWYSVPTLCFSKSSTEFGYLRDQEGFYKYVDNCLKHRKIGSSDSAITRLKLDMRRCRISDASPSDMSPLEEYESKVEERRRSNSHRLDKWLAFAVENKVKELNLYLNSKPPILFRSSFYYCLPETVAKARYLTVMELEGIKLSTSLKFRLPSLKTLSLKDVRLSDVGLDKLLLGCPSLEKFMLSDDCVLTKGRFHSSSLKFLEIERSAFLSIQVEAINLESFILCDVSFEKIHLSACKAIKNLSLSGVVANQSFEDLLSKFPLLENLTLIHWYNSEHIKISSQHLKSFHLKNISEDEVKVTIGLAPNLASFCYEGGINLSVSMDQAPNLLNGNFVIDESPVHYDGDWYIDLMNFLSNLNCSWNIVSLRVSSDEALILPEKVRRVCRSPSLSWKHLKVMTTSEPESELDLREALLWFSPSLETLSINQNNYKVEDLF